MSTFSAAQQDEFGVDAHGRVVDSVRFFKSTAAVRPCLSPGEVHEGVNQEQMMQLLGHALSVGWRQVQLEDADLHGWMSRRSSCQRTCMVKVIGTSLRTLWGTGELISQSGRSRFAKAVGDAVRACYPGFRALNIDGIAQKVSMYVGEELRKVHPDLAESSGFSASRVLLDVEPCLAPDSDAARRTEFVNRMETAVQGAVTEARSRSWKTLMYDARPCQHGCHDAVLRVAVETLWDSGILSLGNSDALALTVLQGALASCFPNLTEKSGAELAGEALLRFQNPVPETPALYGDCTKAQKCAGTGVQCYAQNKYYSQCLHSCPERWECNARRLSDDTAPILA